MKTLVITGGLPQIELVNQLKKRGIYTIVADGSKNPLAKPFADKTYQIDVFNIEAIKTLAIDEQVDFLITVCADQVLLVVAQVSEMLGLPCYIDYQTAQNVSDKLKMKKIFRDNGVPTSRYVETETLEDPQIEKLRYPLVVKPVDAYSSKGVRRAENRKELEQYYYEAKEISRTGGVIVEEFCEGEEISVDAFIINGKAHILCVSNSDKILDDERFVIFRGRVPVNASKEILDEIEIVAQKITDAFGLVNSPLLIQMINDGNHVSVLEFCARTGGNMKYLLIKHSCGVDVISATIDITLGKLTNIEKKDTGNKYVVNDFLYCRPGIYDHLEGFNELVENKVINEYYAIRPVGTQVFGVRSSSDRLVGMNIVANSKEEYNTKLKTINEKVKIIDLEGNDIMRHDLLFPLA